MQNLRILNNCQYETTKLIRIQTKVAMHTTNLRILYLHNYDSDVGQIIMDRVMCVYKGISRRYSFSLLDVFHNYIPIFNKTALSILCSSSNIQRY